MTWTPSEADKRAEKLMLELKATAEACGVQTSTALYPMYHARVFDLISKAIDHALIDGAEQDALDKVVGNGHTEWHVATGPEVQALTNGHSDIPQSDYSHLDMAVANQTSARAFGTHELPTKEAKQHDALCSLAADMKHSMATDENSPFLMPREPEASKKKRGRPKGSKAKKAKPAKAKKADKAAEIIEASAERFAPVMEALASSEPQIDGAAQ